MKLHLSKNRAIALSIVLALILVPVGGYFARGFIRESVAPAYAHLFYARSINNEYNKGLDQVRSIAPFDPLKDASAAPLKCERYHAQKLHTTVGCLRVIDQKIPFSFTSESDFNNKMHSTQKALMDIGWHPSAGGFQSTFRTPLVVTVGGTSYSTTIKVTRRVVFCMYKQRRIANLSRSHIAASDM